MIVVGFVMTTFFRIVAAFETPAIALAGTAGAGKARGVAAIGTVVVVNAVDVTMGLATEPAITEAGMTEVTEGAAIMPLSAGGAPIILRAVGAAMAVFAAGPAIIKFAVGAAIAAVLAGAPIARGAVVAAAIEVKLATWPAITLAGIAEVTEGAVNNPATFIAGNALATPNGSELMVNATPGAAVISAPKRAAAEVFAAAAQVGRNRGPCIGAKVATAAGAAK